MMVRIHLIKLAKQMVELQNTIYKFRFTVKSIKEANKCRKLCNKVTYRYKLESIHN